MSSGATTELNFLGAEKESSSKSQFQKLFDQRRTIQGIQTSISKIDPELLKTMIGSNTSSTPATPTSDVKLPEKAAPLTIFYNGTVSVFNLTPEKAEIIMKLAEEGNILKTVVDATANSTDEHTKLLQKLNGDLPIARKKSLQRFLEKRKERLISVTPYAVAASASKAECVVKVE